MIKKYKIEKEIDTIKVAIFKIKNEFIFNENLEWINLTNNQITKIENLNENLKWIDLNNNQITKIDKKTLELIKKNNIRVIGVDIDKLIIE